MSQDQRTCIVCGRRTNGPVVCYRCFFDYDHRRYEKEKMAKPAAKPAKISEPKAEWDYLDMMDGEFTAVSDRYDSPHKPSHRSGKKETHLLQLPTPPKSKNGTGFLSRLGLF